MPIITDRLNALAARAEWLRMRGKWALRGGLCLASFGMFLWWADPAGPDMFETYLLVPAPLDQQLASAGVAVDGHNWGLVKAGGNVGFFGFVIWAFLGLEMLVTRYVRSGPGRFVIYSSCPVVLLIAAAFLNAGLSSNERFNAVGAGLVVDHEGAPPVPSNWSNRPPVTPYHLRPEKLPPTLADQGRYVLAQQAYFESDPARAARLLRGLTGTWRPARPIDRERIGILDQWTAAHGEEAGASAHEIGGGGPWSMLRRLGALLLWIGAGLVFASGMALDIAGTGRRKRFESLLERLVSAGDEAVLAAPQTAPSSFGRRTAPLVSG